MKLVPGLISVIMSNYNTPEVYLREAIGSILNQTYTNFEFIIIDDCSTDTSLEVIKSYKDKRIVILENEKNIGLTKSLNRGLAVAKGEYVARMDADDISLPSRFEKQIEFLKNNSEVIVCGSGMELFGEGFDAHNEKFVCKILPEKEELRIRLLFGNHTNLPNNVAMFCHEKMLKNNIRYNEKYIFAQDFRMWVECSRYGECQNLDDVLVKYRIHNSAVSIAKKETQKECAKNIMEEQLSWLHLELPQNWEEIHYGFFVGRKKYNLETKAWLKKIINQNKKFKVYNQRKLEELMWGKWTETTYFALAKERNPVRIIKILFNLPLRYWNELLKIRKNRQKREW